MQVASVATPRGDLRSEIEGWSFEENPEKPFWETWTWWLTRDRKEG